MRDHGMMDRAEMWKMIDDIMLQASDAPSTKAFKEAQDRCE
jgi:hypothetical protein